MRVLFLATYFPRPTNERMGTWSLDHAVALRNVGVEVQVVSLTPAFPGWLKWVYPACRTYIDCPKQATLSGLTVTYPRWWCYPIKQLWRWIGRAPRLFLNLGWVSGRRQLLNAVDEFQPDVVLANHSLVNGFVALKLKQLRGLPYITVDHEVGDFLNCSTQPRWLKILKPVIQSASASITVSDTMMQIAKDLLPTGRFQTIYNGAGFEPCDPTALHRHSGKCNPVILCCGNLYGRKDIPLLIKAFDRISQEFPKATLRIAGDGPDRQAIEELIASLDSRDSIQLLGSVEHSVVRTEMLAADIFALVGWAEPFGVVFLEAMASGCAVVVSHDAGVAEVLKDGETALFIEPHNLDSVVEALALLCRNAQRRQAIATAGHRFYSNECRWDKRAGQYVHAFNAAVGKIHDVNS